MKNKLLLMLGLSLCLLPIIAEATPDGPPETRNSRRAVDVPDWTAFRKMTVKERENFIKIIRQFLTAEMRQVYSWERSDKPYSRLVDLELTSDLPGEIREAFRTVIKAMDIINDSQPTHYDYVIFPWGSLAEAWSVLEAWSRAELGTSLEWESMKARHRLNTWMEYEWSQSRIREGQTSSGVESEKTNLSESIKEDDDSFDRIKKDIPIYGDPVTGTEEQRDLLMKIYSDTYMKIIGDALKEGRIYSSDNKEIWDMLPKSPIEGLPEKLNELLVRKEKLRKEFQETKEKSFEGQMEDTLFMLKQEMIKLSGLSFDEYVMYMDDCRYTYINRVMKEVYNSPAKGMIKDDESLRTMSTLVEKLLYKQWQANGLPVNFYPPKTALNEA